MFALLTRTRAVQLMPLVLVLLLCTVKLPAQSTLEDNKEFPVPEGNPQQLFYLQRTENINTVVYEVNEQNGNLNTENPIHIFWVMYAKQKQHEELNEVEKKFAYGIKIESAGKEVYGFTLVAYPKMSLQLAKDVNQKYCVYAATAEQKMILRRVYIKIKEEEFALKPVVEYMELSGVDVISGKEITKRITP